MYYKPNPDGSYYNHTFVSGNEIRPPDTANFPIPIDYDNYNQYLAIASQAEKIGYVHASRDFMYYLENMHELKKTNPDIDLSQELFAFLCDRETITDAIEGEVCKQFYAEHKP